MRIHGSYVALVTPFREGKVDTTALRNLVEFQLTNGTDGLVACGSTGETPTLDPEEYETVLRTVVEVAGHRAPVIAGTGSSSTAATIATTRLAAEAGAAAALVVVPPYNKPSQEGLARHFEAVAADSTIPIVLYDVPSRTGSQLDIATLERLAAHPRIVALKDATGCPEHTSRALAAVGDRMTVLSGDDALTFPLMALGAHGVISVTANVVPARVAELVRAAAAGDLAAARRVHYELAALNAALFLESNPVPVKTALAHLGRITGELRLPLCEMDPGLREELLRVLSRYVS